MPSAIPFFAFLHVSLGLKMLQRRAIVQPFLVASPGLMISAGLCYNGVHVRLSPSPSSYPFSDLWLGKVNVLLDSLNLISLSLCLSFVSSSSCEVTEDPNLNPKLIWRRSGGGRSSKACSPTANKVTALSLGTSRALSRGQSLWSSYALLWVESNAEQSSKCCIPCMVSS